MKKSNPSESDLRRQAEAELSKQKKQKKKKKTAPATEADTLKLIHELEVHQIELEMQNDELAQSRAQAEAAYRQYADLYDFAPVGYLTLARDGMIHKINLAGASLLGMERNELIQRRLGIFVLVQSRRAFNVFFEKLLSGKGKETCELEFEINGHEPLWARLEAACFEAETECHIAMMDITGRKRADEALRYSQAFMNSIIEHSPTSLWVSDERGTMIRMNQACRDILHLRDAEVVGKYNIFNDNILEEQGLMPLVRDVFEKGAAARFVISYDTAAVKGLELAQTARFDLDVSISPILNPQGKVSNLIVQHIDITERKQMEDVLRESELRFREVLENSLDASYKRNLKTNSYDYMSPVFDRISGYTAGEMKTMLTETVVNLMHPDDQAEVERVIAESISGAEGTPYQVDYRFKHKDGEYSWFHDQFIVTRDAQGQPVARIGSVADITARKRADEALHENQELFSLFMRYSPVYTYIKTVTPTESRIVQASDNFQEMIGVSSAEMIGKTVDELFPAEFAAKISADDLAVVSRGKVLKLDEDLNDRHYTTIKFPIVHGDKTLLAGYTIDITERKQAEEALRVSESRLHLATSAGNIGIWDWNVVKDELIWDDSMYSLYGIHKDDFGGAYQAWTRTLHPDDRQYVEQEIQAALRGEREYAPEFRVVRPDGAVRIFKAASQTMRGQNGNALRMIGINYDITERKQAEDNLLIAKEALEAANSKLQAAFDSERQLARTDMLTGVNNRRHLFELAERAFEVAERYQQPLSVIMFDIDSFKNINDVFGHALGDQTLQRVTQAACAELRSVDIIGRYGGEEFVIILPMTNAQDAHSLAERIRVGVAAIRIPTEKGDAAVTLSIGIAEAKHTSGESLDSMLICADKAMYAAKQAGRNRTVICEKREVISNQ